MKPGGTKLRRPVRAAELKASRAPPRVVPEALRRAQGRQIDREIEGSISAASGRCSGSASRQREQRDPASGLGLELAQRGRRGDEFRPQRGIRGAGNLFCQRCERFGAAFDGDCRMCFEVVVPRGRRWRSAVRGGDDEAAVGLRAVRERGDSLGCGLGAGVMDEDDRSVGQAPADTPAVCPELSDDVLGELTRAPWL